MPLISLTCVILSCLLGYILQKNCKNISIRYRGRKIEMMKKMVVAEVHDIFMKNGQYFAGCIVQNNTVQQSVIIDKAMMAAMPDLDGDGHIAPPKVLLYEEVQDDNSFRYTLTPEEIRFKTNLKVIQTEKKTMADIQAASKVIGFYYDIRLVLWTLAWVGVYRSPTLSIIFSAIAAWISWRNVIPFRYTLSAKCGIIKVNEEPNLAPKKEKGLPPGYDNWTEESKYMYELEQKVTEKQSATVDRAKTERSMSESFAIKLSPESSEGDSPEEQDGQEDIPFFTDEELDSVDEENETDEAESEENVDDSESPDDDDDEFDADGFEVNEPLSESTEAVVDEEKENSLELVPSTTEREGLSQKHAQTRPKRRSLKKNSLAEKLNALVGDDYGEA